MKEQRTTVDDAEIDRFTRMADEWWNPHGKFKPLHDINPLRVSWIEQLAGPLAGKTLLDIGCGGGLISEPMAALDATVTGIDAGEKNIKVATLHAEKSGVKVDYRCTTAEDLAATGAQFDVVVALEIIEHVADVAEFVKASVALLKPGGKIFYSTLNRTPKSYALAILGAEYILRWLPIGTHTWKKFLKPSELCAELRKNGIEITEMTGMVMNPLTFKWRLDEHDLSVNYLVAGVKPI
ncbi:MAG: bifunctional 2-polyprenyl-6-hydroxyphenol methylase/3-demethylubiquinol 3-O-methyltransferase UbiG [Alphaproteobacteria bacterium]|nr:bifunctional 2-polyprenyl-6-hydroxyphenol methylase/3-demethylubiquinol 3-O-methyltransferase UbiG [Alphaproteobacteria bacterium]